MSANELKSLSKFDSNRDAHDNWRNADKLSFGWFGYSPFELKDRYRDSGQNEQLSRALEFEMQMLIREQIASGDIVALGLQISPELQYEAEQIPKVLFQSDEVEIDWERGQISGLGRQYNDARICLSPNPNKPIERPNAGMAANAARSGGRPSQYPKIREVLQALFTEDSRYEGYSASRLLDLFNDRYLAKFTLPGVRLAPVSDRSLREHLKRYRQELAETGNN